MAVHFQARRSLDLSAFLWFFEFLPIPTLIGFLFVEMPFLRHMYLDPGDGAHLWLS